MAAALFLIAGLSLPGCLAHHEAPRNPTFYSSLELPTGKVRYFDRGEGEAIVLLHGFGGAIESWEQTVDALPKDRRILAMDARGFGLSTRAEGDYSLKALANDVNFAMESLGIEKASIVGHSWGSAVALVLALEHPERVERLVLVDGLAYEKQVPWSIKAARRSGLGELIVGTFYTAQLDARLEKGFFDPSRLSYDEVASVRYKLEAPGSRAAALAISRGVDLEAWQPRYSEIEVPTMIVWGKQDRVLSPWWAGRLATDLTQARVETLDRCGHFPMIEAPRRFAALLEDFIQ